MNKPNRIHLFVRGKSNLNQLKLTSEAAGKINQGGLRYSHPPPTLRPVASSDVERRHWRWQRNAKHMNHTIRRAALFTFPFPFFTFTSCTCFEEGAAKSMYAEYLCKYGWMYVFVCVRVFTYASKLSPLRGALEIICDKRRRWGNSSDAVDAAGDDVLFKQS